MLPLPETTARMLRFDLRRARAGWIRDCATKADRRDRRRSDFLSEFDHDGKVCDCHSLRHTYISRLISSGASVKIAQELARHSTPNLTIGRYAHVRINDLTRALDNLPTVVESEVIVEPAALRATGTDGAGLSRPDPPSATPPAKSPAVGTLFDAKRCDGVRCPGLGGETPPNYPGSLGRGG